MLFAAFVLEDYYRSIAITTTNLSVQLIMHVFLMFLWRPQEYSNIFPYNHTTLEMNDVQNKSKENQNTQKETSLSLLSSMKKLGSNTLLNNSSNKTRNGTNVNNGQYQHPNLRFRGTVVQLRDHLNILYNVTDQLEKSIDEVFDKEGDEAFTPIENKDQIIDDFKSSTYLS